MSVRMLDMCKLLAFTLTILLCFNAPSFAQEEIPVPTLDKLQGQAIPDTDPMKYYPGSGYTLTPADKAGVNTITRYEWNETTNKLDEKYYTIDLKQKEYGNTDLAGAEVKDITVTVPNADGTGNAFEYAIKYYVDSNRLSGRLTSFTENENIDKDFVGNYAPPNINAGAIFNKGKSNWRYYRKLYWKLWCLSRWSYI